MKNIIKSLALVALLALATTASAHDKHDTHGKAAQAKTADSKDAFKAKGDGEETCPVTGEKLESKDVKGEFFGRTVYFCCAGCMAEAKKSPAAYVKPTLAEQRAALKAAPKSEAHGEHHHGAQDAAKGESKFLGKGDGITTCPVTGEAVNKELKGEANGRTFYVCCAGCLDTVKKNPDLYLKKDEKKAEK